MDAILRQRSGQSGGRWLQNTIITTCADPTDMLALLARQLVTQGVMNPAMALAAVV